MTEYKELSLLVCFPAIYSYELSDAMAIMFFGLFINIDYGSISFMTYLNQ